MISAVMEQPHSAHFKSPVDVIIGNPPYVEYSVLASEYTLLNYRTITTGNSYSYVIERSFTINDSGLIGFIVQLPIVCTDRMIPLQKLCMDISHGLWCSNYDDRPGKLFDGLEDIRATIMISSSTHANQYGVYATKYNRWYSEVRDSLFQNLHFENMTICM